MTGATLTDLGRVDADEDGCGVGLIPLDALDVDAELLPAKRSIRKWPKNASESIMNYKCRQFL